MGDKTAIEWCDKTFNPWWGCTKVSPACDRCYAETFSRRVGYSESGSKFPIWGKDAERRFFGDKHWAEPLKWDARLRQSNVVRARWKEPPLRERVFCGSMCDVMEDRRDLDAPRQRLYGLIEATPSLDWLLLTKRPQNFRRFLPEKWLEKPRPNVWLLTTIESAEYYWRWWELSSVPAVVRGISYEPALGPITIGGLLDLREPHKWPLWKNIWRPDWLIAGGESGHGARPVHPDWVRSIRDQCARGGVAFHFKQFGEWKDGVRVGKKAAGRLLDGVEHNGFPEVAR